MSDPASSSAPALKALVAALADPHTLVPARMAARAFAPAFPPLSGALDPLPDFGDPALVEALTGFRFKATEGVIWKENGARETYAPSSQADFSLVPKDYAVGLVPTNEDACNLCHTQAGRPLGDFISDVAAYGEVWGEDRIFTWHLFEPSDHIFGPWDDDQGSRVLNPRLVQAGLVVEGRPAAADPVYQELPRPYARGGARP